MSARERLAGGARPLDRLGPRTALLLALAAFLPYLNGLGNDFTYDDKVIIRDNPRVASPTRASEIFTTHYFGTSLATGTSYRPLVLLSYAVERWVHGNVAPLFRLVNVALHAGTTVLLAAWLLALGFPRGPTLATASLFAVATIHVEAVTGLVGRAEGLAAFLVFLSALLFLRAGSGPRFRVWAYAGSLLSFLCAVFVKENAVVLPGVVLLGELVRGGADPHPFRRLAARVKGLAFPLAGLLAPVVVLFAVRRLVLHGYLISREAAIFDLENPLVTLSGPVRAGNAAWLLLRYVEKTFLPIGLSADHSAYALPLDTSLARPHSVAGLLGLLVLVLLPFVLLRRRPLAAFGVALFLGTSLPAANLLFPIGTIYAERLAYLPSAGLFAAAVGLLSSERLIRPGWREALLALALLGQSGATLARNRVFASDEALYADMVAKMPGSAKAHYNLAFDAQRRGEAPLARKHLLRAVEVFPRHYDAWAILGKLALDEKRWDEAIARYGKSAEILPSYENGRWGLAKSYEGAGRVEEATRAFDDAARALPVSYAIAYHRAAFLLDQGRLEAAEAEWRRAIPLGKGAAAVHLGLARTLSRLGREEAALDEARRALQADPGLASARLFLAGRFEVGGKLLAAGAELTRATKSAPWNTEAAALLLEVALRHPGLRGRAEALVPLIEERHGRLPVDRRLREALGRFRLPG